jgi:hypothetical protein
MARKVIPFFVTRRVGPGTVITQAALLLEKHSVSIQRGIALGQLFL